LPVKNESKVVGRILDSMVRLNYPSDRFEVVIVDDGSLDGTVEICAPTQENIGNETSPLLFSLKKLDTGEYSIDRVKSVWVEYLATNSSVEPHIKVRRMAGTSLQLDATYYAGVLAKHNSKYLLIDLNKR